MLRIRRTEPQTAATEDDGTPSRGSFRRGLLELNAVKTLTDISDALERGVAFTIDGFRKRNAIGYSTLQAPQNSELLADLRDNIARIDKILLRSKKKIIRGKLKSTGGSSGPRLPRKTRESARRTEVEALLEARNQDLDRALAELTTAKREIAELKARLNHWFV